MKSLRYPFLALLLSTLAVCAQSVLFVGNSFTLVPMEYGAGTVNDLHGKDIGGIPAIFKELAKEGGHEPEVSSELSGGKTLEWHYNNQADKIDQPWDIVVLQEYSSRPLTTTVGGASSSNREAFLDYAQKLIELVRQENPDVKVYLYETWARPNLVEKGYFDNLADMQTELREGYQMAAEQNDVTGVVPVGDAFMKAVRNGISDDPSTEEKEGSICLWGGDHYHQNEYGAYLSALVMYAKIYQADPRELPVGEGSAAARLGIDPEVARSLQDLAGDIVSSAG